MRGLAPWKPQAKTQALLADVGALLEEDRAYLPLTARQLFYRLIGSRGYDKSEGFYERLCETLNRARRAGLVSWEAIRDDGVTMDAPSGFHGLPDFWRVVQGAADTYRRDRLLGQPYHPEVWVEAGGMVPQAARVAAHYGIPVFSSGGFDSVTAKFQAARRFLARGKPTIVLHAGDHDPSGLSVFDSAAEDIGQMCADLDADHPAPQFRRVAVTPEQIQRFALVEAPRKEGDRRGNWTGGTVQAEALRPADLAAEIRRAIEDVIDSSALARVLVAEEEERGTLSKRLAELAGGLA